MSCNSVITIGRQFGSGGNEIAKLLAKKLDIKCYDKQLIFEAAKESGVNPKVFENVDERATNSLLYSLSMGIYTVGGTGYAPIQDLPVNDELYLLQHKIIKEVSCNPCVILGRCGDYVLRDLPNLVSVFLYADLDFRVKRIIRIQKEEITENKAESIIKKADKTRSNYYSFYTGKNWGAMENYDICINTASLSKEQIVDAIISYVKVKEL